MLWSDFKRNQKCSAMKLIFGKGKVTVYGEHKMYFQRRVTGEGCKKAVPDGRTNKWENKLYHSPELYMAIHHLMGRNLREVGWNNSIKINELSKSSWGHGERHVFSKSFCLNHTFVLSMPFVFLLQHTKGQINFPRVSSAQPYQHYCSCQSQHMEKCSRLEQDAGQW